jgi:transposase
MKQVNPLLLSEVVTLQEAQKNSTKAHFRTRCYAIELSNRGKSVSYIADLLMTRTDTIYTWINRWESSGIVGLMILSGRGLKAKLRATLEASVELIKKK